MTVSNSMIQPSDSSGALLLIVLMVGFALLFFVNRNERSEIVIPPTDEELRLIRQLRIEKVMKQAGDVVPGGRDVKEKAEGATAVVAAAVDQEPEGKVLTFSDTTQKDSISEYSLAQVTIDESERAGEIEAAVVEHAVFDKSAEVDDDTQPPVVNEIETPHVATKEVANSPAMAAKIDGKNSSQSSLSDTLSQEKEKSPVKDQIKKRARKTVVPPQIVSEVLSSISKLQVVIVCAVNCKEYIPRSIDARHHQVIKIDMKDESFDSVEFPPLPDSFRDIAGWFARAHAISREGFPPIMVQSTEGYDSFQQMLKNLMDKLVVLSCEYLESDTSAIDDTDDEEDLFSEYVAPAQKQGSSSLYAFLDLLEDTACPVGRPFLDRVLTIDLATNVLHRALLRLESPFHLLCKRATAILMLLNSPIVVKAWAKQVDHKEKWLQPLLQACAYCVPEAGSEQPSPSLSPFRKEVEQLDKFPVCILERHNKQVGVFMEQTRMQMQAARNVAERLLRKGGKDNTFAWLAYTVRSNEAFSSLLRGDLLSTTHVGSVSRGFLMGLCASTVSLNCESLVDLFSKDRNAFDYRYFQNGRVDTSDSEFMLVRNQKKSSDEKRINFTGATELFFLTCGLLHVSLYPAMRVEAEFARHYNRVFAVVRQAAEENKALPPHTVAVSKPVMSAFLGWRIFLDDPKLVTALTKFSILQMEWVQSQGKHLEAVPEWMIKNPATWLAHVAQTQPRLLKPYQAEAVVECATQLLQLGTKANDDRVFSPVVIDDLVKIIAAFVSAGVNHARQRQKRQREEDDRDASLYLSFDANDLGVTVFTNRLVSTELCPTLMQTFGAVDVVEGLDVDREHGFDKFSAKGRIAELFLRLWSHPNGECRASVSRMDGERVAQFAKELEIAIGVLFDFSCNRMADICNGSKRKNNSPQESAFLLGQGRSVASELYYARLWIMVLCKISEERRIRRILGSCSLVKDLASLLIHLIDILTDPDGGIHRNLDLATERSAHLLSSFDSMDATKKERFASEIVRARFVCRFLYGLDVAALCHQFLALMSSWHKQARDNTGGSPFLVAFALHEDYEEERYRNVVQRLVAEKYLVEGSEADCADQIFAHDGYVDMSNLEEKYKKDYESKNLNSPETESQKNTARKDQMSRESIMVIAKVDDILLFLDDAEAYKKRSSHSSNSFIAIPQDKLEGVFDEILSSASDASLELYGDKLSDWVVTSDSFASKDDSGGFNHYYNATVRTRGVACSGKTMVKEARRCHKNLPIPHPNSAAFCCFGEERMDLCRACITGPVDTPYALGIFVFEVFFPSNFPTIPPLVTFMTTGGGQTRFNPNLYSDGKVCLSLLGTFHAQDESQKWNPEYSSLAQILLSIQTQLLVEEPYFNEPGNEIRQGTPHGTESSNRYNLVLQLATLRHAIIAPLKNPPIGLEEICLRHFGLCRSRVLVQARRWMLQAQNCKSTLFPRFQRAYSELISLIAAKFSKEAPALPPCQLDIKALEALDAPIKSLERKPAAVSVSAAVPTAAPAEIRHRIRRVRRVAPGHQEVTELTVAQTLMTAVAVLEENPWVNPSADATSNSQNVSNQEPDSDDEIYD